MRSSAYGDLEDGLLQWFKQTRSALMPVSGPMLAEVAERLAKEMNMPDWKCSNGFLERFKKRHSITFKVAAGEAASVEGAAVNDWVARLPKILEGYSADDVFNMDETGVFYKMLPDRTLCFRDEKCHGGKRAKDRLTAAVCCNMSGSEKWPLLVIGKSQNPRCFKNVKSLPVTYKANKRAWMTGELFEQWVVTFDAKMKRQKRKVLLFVDNCPAHADVTKLSATKLVFLPPNTTSVLQPCDQGIIYAFKQQYRKRVVRHMLHCMEQQRDAVIDVKIAIDFMHAAWNAVSQSAIVNCFRKAHFIISPVPVDDEGSVDVDDIPLAMLTDDEWAAVSDGSLTFDQYVSADDVLLTTEVQSVEEIAATCSRNNEESNSDDENDDTSQSDQLCPAPVTVSRVQAITAMNTVRSFTESLSDVPDAVFDAIARIHDFVYNMQSCITQPRITHFFTPRDTA